MIFLDSSLIVAHSNEADENHAKALEIIKDVTKGRYGTSVITDYIFDEVMTVMLAKTKSVTRTVDLGEKLLGAALLLRIDGSSFDLAWKIFREQRKQVFSFTDCASIATCRANGISNIATFDGDFQGIEEFTVIGL